MTNTATKFSGYCASIPVKKGMKVQIAKGTYFTTTGPGKIKQAGRTYTVTVFSVDNGCDAYTNYHGEAVPARDPSFDWVGTGSYWCRLDLNELLAQGGKIITDVDPNECKI